MEMSHKVREGKHQHLADHGLIKLVVMNALSHLRVPALWTKFVDMDREDFIETQSIRLKETIACIVGGKEGKIEEEEATKSK